MTSSTSLTDTIDVVIQGQRVPISMLTFMTLLENSVAGTYAAYPKALESRRLSHADLLKLAKVGEIPYPLFFAPHELVQQQVKTKTEKLLQGLGRDTFSIGSRDRVELRDVELIVKDLIRKQQLLRKFDSTLVNNEIIGLLAKNGASVESDAAKLAGALALSSIEIRACRTSKQALTYLINKLESKQILVAQSVQNYMPQQLRHVKFSGMTIRDNKVPYIFLAGGSHKDAQEPTGRTIFTLTLMAVLVARKIFAPMTWDGGNTKIGPGREYDITGEILMPSEILREFDLSTLEGVKLASREFKVTPSAIAVRGLRLGVLQPTVAGSHLEELRAEYLRLSQSSPRNQMLPVNAVLKYNGKEFTKIMLHAFDGGKISPSEFRRVVCLNRLKPSQFGDLRQALP